MLTISLTFSRSTERMQPQAGEAAARAEEVPRPPGGGEQGTVEHAQ